ncbi:MAG: glycosyltransferase family 4 protein [Desulfobacula sp.]|nr:glycosyltransferase family 4 protein [Desulfobacula sp.]
MKNIILEASIIGQGLLNPALKTGIFRYATMLTETLLSRNDINPYICLSALQHSEMLVSDYFIKKKYALKYLFPNRLIENRIYEKLYNLPNFPHKYGTMLYVSKLFQLTQKRKIKKKNTLFHSFFFPFPKNLFSNGIIKFITIHDIIALKHPEFFTPGLVNRVKGILNSINKHKDWIIAVSESTKQDLIDLCVIPENRIFVTHLAASKDIYFQETDNLVIQKTLIKYNIPDKNYFLSIATLEPRKNLLFALKCFHKVINEPGLNHLKFVIAGSKGWLIDELYDYVDSNMQLRKNVIFTGYIPDLNLSAIYGGAMAFLYPSLYEGFGLPPLEAMQCGTPVITSNSSSLPEVIGDAGIMVDPNDEDALCQAMVDIAKTKSLRSDLSQKGLERSAFFSWDKCVDETIRAYHFALENKKQ